MFAEAPEDVETRSLFEQLQAQKEAKQLDYEEQHRLSLCLFTFILRTLLLFLDHLWYNTGLYP